MFPVASAAFLTTIAELHCWSPRVLRLGWVLNRWSLSDTVEGLTHSRFRVIQIWGRRFGDFAFASSPYLW